MINIAFWNLNRKPVEALLGALARKYSVDLLILAENLIPQEDVLRALNLERQEYQARPWKLCTKITAYMRFHAGFLEPQHESDRFLICRLRFPARPDILLAMAHLPSKAHGEEEGRLYECQLLSQAVKEVEAKVGHTRTVLVGDLNVNPFEKSVVGTLGLHAVMAKDVAKRNTRKVQDREYQFFYNPMWSHFGERAKGPPGTYYYGAGGHINYFWNIFDQVLLRPDLIEKFPEDELQILTSIGDVDLLGASGKPDQRIASDHLPIFFKLDI